MANSYSSIAICACAALLTGCGGHSGGLSPFASNAKVPVEPQTGSQTFGFTGAEQTFTVPSGVRHVRIAASGASGGICTSSCSTGYGTDGKGSLVAATIPVTPGETLYVFVGGDNGYNGGGMCVSGSCYGPLNGGGASDVRQGGDQLQDRVIVAGGGGGAGFTPLREGVGGNGGSGGARRGAAGSMGSGYENSGSGGHGGAPNHGGSGGSGGVYHHQARYIADAANVKPMPQCSDGCGSCSGKTGTAGALGMGGEGAAYCGGPGGGGGGGYYGGGGGGSGAGYYYGLSGSYGGGGGGGGGSSFVEKAGSRVIDKRGGAALGNGDVVISW